jgi:hypothetical protein
VAPSPKGDADFFSTISGSSKRHLPPGVSKIVSPAREEADYFATVEKAKEMMFAMSGLPPGFVVSRSWKSVYADPSSNTNLWMEKTKKDGNAILLRGTFSVPSKSSNSSIQSIMKWLLEEDLVTGIEVSIDSCDATIRFDMLVPGIELPV